MKNIKTSLIFFLTLSLITSLILPSAVYAGNGTVVITATGNDGKKVSGQEITCTKTKNATPGGYPPAPQFTYLKTNSQGVATWSISAEINYTYDCYGRSALSPDGCYYTQTPTPRHFTLSPGQTKTVSLPMKKQSSCSSTGGSKTTGSSSTKATDPTAAIASATLPSAFTQKDSTTSSFKNLKTSKAKAFKNLTLEVVGIGKIVWNENVDLSSKDLKDKFNKLGDYVKVTKGQVGLDATIGQLQKKATITLQANLREKPVVKQKAFATTAQPNPEWTNVSADKVEYNSELKVVTIKIETWNEFYMIDPGLELDTPTSPTTDPNITISGKVNYKDIHIAYKTNTEDTSVEIIPNDGVFNKTITRSPGETVITVLVRAGDGDTIESTLATKEIKVTVENAPELNWWERFTNWLGSFWK